MVGSRAVLVGIFVAIGPGATRADETARVRADQHARRGYDLAQAQKLEPAIEAFKQALAIHPRAVYLCNIGLAYSELGRLHRAHWFLGQCLERWSETEDTSIDPRVTKYLAVAAGQLERGANGRARLRVEPGDAVVAIPTAFAADETVRPQRIVWLPEGTHTIRITRDDFRPLEATFTITRGAQLEVEYSLEPVRTSSAAMADRPLATADPPGMAAPIAVLSIGVAGLVAGGVTHGVALDRRATAADLPPGAEFDAASASYDRWRTGAIALYVGGAVTAGLGTLWLVSRRRARARRPSLSGSAGADHALVTAGWRF